ncbi:hypothetical protein JI667_20065 [Bacillus sp. NTK074B]|uniref:hypothetical protein n=1 Tax=Bacillus sp. NTK074B TaxID=2802174 RepID=UPI001A8EEE6A|nr:hypothetical protein [Bacillus sp. NTK074B]
MDNKIVSFKESRIFHTTFLLILVGFIFSFIPEENWLLFGINMGIASGCFLVFSLLWWQNRHHSKRYFSLHSYFMIVALSVYFAIPLFRVFAGTFVFWLGLLLIIVMSILPYIYSERIAIGVQNPSRTGLGKLYLLISALIIGYGTILFLNANLTANPDAFTISIFCFMLSLLFLFIAHILLITPKRMDELKK